MSGEEYAEVLVGSLPAGKSIRRDSASNTWKLLHAFGEELSRVDARAEDLRVEADPSRATELISEWESLVGLPDGCSPPAATLADRRTQVVERLAFLGDQRPEAYVALAARLGIAVTVEEPRPMRCGDLCGSLMNVDEWRHVFYVRAPATTITDFLCGDPLGGLFRTFGDPLLECGVARKAPAHSRAFVTYGA